jgi:hypothetical protein
MDPRDRTKRIPLILHPQSDAKFHQSGMDGAQGDYWGLIHGRPPLHPDPEARNRFSAQCMQVLLSPTAIYQGLRRPMHFGYPGADDDVLIYVARPPDCYRFKHHRDYGGVLEAKERPARSVFTAFVSLEPFHVDGARRLLHNATTCADGLRAEGVLLFWEWTLADPENEELPEETDTRYEKRIMP